MPGCTIHRSQQCNAKDIVLKFKILIVVWISIASIRTGVASGRPELGS